jgi:hypothetical protein
MSEKEKKKYVNKKLFEFEDETFTQGLVKIGPFLMTKGMVETEMATVESGIPVNSKQIAAFIEGKRIQSPSSRDRAGKKDKEEHKHESEGDELIPKNHGKKKHAGNDKDEEGYSTLATDAEPLSPGGQGLTTKDKKELGKAKLSDHDTVLYISAKKGSIENPQIDDYKVSWVVKKLPTEHGNVVKTHTIMAAQRPSGSGGELNSWIPDSVAEFHLDYCCKFVCCLGFNFVEDPPHGMGLISCLDSAIASNASSDESQGNVELGHTDKTTSADNSRKVEKCVAGNMSKEDLLHEMEESNDEKTKCYRWMGFFCMLIGFQMMMSPFPAFFGFIPLVGACVGSLVWVALSFVACIVGCFGATMTISIAWVRYRPCLGIAMMLVSGGIAAAVVFIPWDKL